MMDRNDNTKNIAQIWLEGFRQTADDQSQAQDFGIRF